MFATLSLMLVASFLFAYLEYARSEGLRAYVKMDPPSSTASLLSMYNREAFTRYGIFVLDGACGKDSLDTSELAGILQKYSQNNLKPVHDKKMLLWDTVNMFQMDVSDVSVEEVLIATDHDGEPFRRLCADAMRYEYPIDVARDLYNKMEEDATQAENAKNDADNATSGAYDAVDSAKQSYVDAYSTEDGPPVIPPEPQESPVDKMDEVKNMDMLTLLVPAEKSISNKKMTQEKSLTKRTLCKGNMEFTNDADWYERFLFDEFLYQHFTNYQTTQNDPSKALDYELEYIVSGKGSDRDNLKQVATDILGIREGMNFLYLLSSGEKRGEAQSLATAILAPYPVAEVANLALTAGILAAWAFAESVLDVRSLLAGGKIAWFKSDEDWTLGLSNIANIVSNGLRAKEPSSGGVDYDGYVRSLLYTKFDKTLNYRTMDIIENQVHQKAQYKNVKMDHMIISIRAKFCYKTSTLFSGLTTVGNAKVQPYEFSSMITDTYLKGT